ncbi:cell filamentation protein Fic [Trinickia symbiotica]|uniref:Cell filamentation protein Fic n=1 Tax=Trinickia symbiotica TaxID=863227 RepID=A0A2N7X7P7_9BURK|nr:cell filamentation protein Fic [Trinickia symbiotica]
MVAQDPHAPVSITCRSDKLTSSKWASIAKCSPDTALRDISELVSHGALRRSAAGGRSTSYELPDLNV